MSRSSLKLGQVGSKTRSLGQILEKNLLYTLGCTVLSQSSQNFIRMLMIIIARSSSKVGHVGSKPRSQGQILEKPCVHSSGNSLDPSAPSRGHSFDSKLKELQQNVNDHNI